MKNKFVRSCQKNSKEAQEALIALGYEWSANDGKARYLDAQFVFTDEDGRLAMSNDNLARAPCLYDFTEETNLVATLIDSTPVHSRELIYTKGMQREGGLPQVGMVAKAQTEDGLVKVRIIAHGVNICADTYAAYIPYKDGVTTGKVSWGTRFVSVDTPEEDTLEAIKLRTKSNLTGTPMATYLLEDIKNGDIPNVYYEER